MFLLDLSRQLAKPDGMRRPVSFISCASSTSITWEPTASRRRPAFSSHLVSPTISSSDSLPNLCQRTPHYLLFARNSIESCTACIGMTSPD